MKKMPFQILFCHILQKTKRTAMEMTVIFFRGIYLQYILKPQHEKQDSFLNEWCLNKASEGETHDRVSNSKENLTRCIRRTVMGLF